MQRPNKSNYTHTMHTGNGTRVIIASDEYSRMLDQYVDYLEEKIDGLQRMDLSKGYSNHTPSEYPGFDIKEYLDDIVSRFREEE